MTVPSGNTLPPLTLDPFALTKIANQFLDGVELLGYACPRVSYCLDDISRGRSPISRFAPDDRNRDPANTFALIRTLRSLESQFNPDGLPHRDPRRIQRITQWAGIEEQFQLCQKTSMEALTGTKWRNAVSLAMVVDTIWDWWHLNDDTDADCSLSNLPLTQLPRGVIAAMKKAASNLVWAGEDDTRPLQPPRQRKPRQASHARDAAQLVDLICNSITSVVHCDPRVGGPLLLSLLDDLQESADLIPTEGWEQCIGSAPFEVAGAVAATAHQATLPFAQRFCSLPWSAARQEKFECWGKLAADWFIPPPFVWDDSALPALARRLSENPPVPVQRWLAQLEVEAARLRSHTTTRQTVPDEPGQTEKEDWNAIGVMLIYQHRTELKSLTDLLPRMEKRGYPHGRTALYKYPGILEAAIAIGIYKPKKPSDANRVPRGIRRTDGSVEAYDHRTGTD